VATQIQHAFILDLLQDVPVQEYFQAAKDVHLQDFEGEKKSSTSSLGESNSWGLKKMKNAAQDKAKGAMVKPLTQLLKAKLPYSVFGSKPIHPLIEATVRRAVVDGNATDAATQFILGLVAKKARPVLGPILGAAFNGNMTLLWSLVYTQLTTSPKNKEKANLMTQLYHHILIKTVKFNPCRSECVCRNFLHLLFDRRFKLEATIFNFSASGISKELWQSDPVISQLGKRARAATSAEEYANVVRSSLRNIANSPNPPLVCERKPGPGPERDRDCILGTIVRDGMVIERKLVDTDEVSCQMRVFYRMDVCETCCCDSEAKVLLSTELTMNEHSTCKGWFMWTDGLVRGMFGIGRGLVIPSVGNLRGLTCD